MDVYGGSGGVLLHKPYCPIEIYNDLEDEVANLFHVLADNLLFGQFHWKTRWRISSTSWPITSCSASFSGWPSCRCTAKRSRMSSRRGGGWNSPYIQPFIRAFMFWYVNRTRHNGIGGFSITTVIRRGMNKSTSDMLSGVEGLASCTSGCQSVVVCHRDALELIPKCDRVRTLIYLDPPYVHSTRGYTRYRVDADDAHHEALVEALNGLKYARVVLSGYANPLYDTLWGFSREDFEVSTTSGTGEPKTKLESIRRKELVSHQSKGQWADFIHL